MKKATFKKKVAKKVRPCWQFEKGCKNERRYCKYKFKVSEKDFEIINLNLIKLQELVNKTNMYKKNKKPISIPVLKRSIF